MWHINPEIYTYFILISLTHTPANSLSNDWITYLSNLQYIRLDPFIYILTLFPRRKTSCISFIYTIAPSNTFSTAAAALRITTIKQFKPLINMRKHRILHLIYSSMYKERSHLKISLSLCYIIKIMWHFHTKKNHSITKQKYNPDLMHAHAHKNRPYNKN